LKKIINNTLIFINKFLLLSIMGRIKTRFEKTSGKKIYSKVKSDVSEDFQKNKDVVTKYAEIPSKRLRNKIVGYVTRLYKQEQKEEA